MSRMKKSSKTATAIRKNYARIYSINLPGLKAAIILFSAFFLCMLIYACVVKYSETTLAQGVIINAKGDVQVRAKTSGSIIDIPVRQGQYVNANDVLFTLSQDYGGKEGSIIEFDAQRFSAEKARNSERIESIIHTIEGLRKNLTAQLVSVDAQIAGSRIKIQKAHAVVGNLENTLKSWKEVAAKGYASQMELSQRQNELLSAQLNLKLEESNLLQQQSTKTSLTDNSQYQINDLNTQMLSLQNRNGEIERSLSTQGSKTLAMLAPTSGFVVAINFPPGKAVSQESEVVMVIRQDEKSPLEGFLYIPSRGAGRIQTDSEVTVRIDSWPVDKYGSIKSKLKSFYPVNIDSHSALIPLQQGESYFLARVELPASFKDADGKSRDLLGGMTLNADIVIDRKPVIALLLAPLERARQRFFSLGS